ncbi:16S rRNA (guanine(527)-N(7))-methyltransferase RsmG [Vagococcus lutrae]|uniref:Ribosomal RNA small subunit methyltransferase G n=2 Tax=Vagococcus lutrae TaxID=81947 RepID=V6Q3B8_9ENTE|nr:16S rRNA (guanine(527)-N(7))-methyltransferase RsmG [Vagococcus lutrae]EST89145.1 16S rRNA (guanine(527)-N(7))-methyltransferase GidB [Vagococcus lutrae LBD1]MCO7150484.1 16S rRNA (guanine(527)-N(7))-methyltransferase RsmG [Vagococcus lutrae]MDT2802237.1 16S rRNA (guanine(527)-N(7))-methyltransferase RsmG [Vagococcus lutrae]MDT2806034.1 16S rRNA (guanine(527)-N(7))-methyltransferase RsmG [Vagococcus lutrae]MDT2811669.1 16S rRNA (guanine(527)-N(7))-methyltransferase RsmG [Vagococcus lutrae]
MKPEQFRELLAEKGVVLTDQQMAQYRIYFDYLVEWNAKINLTAITDQEGVYLKHFYDSLTLSFIQEFDNEAYHLCDVGSGAGFPSIPLKIAFPHLKITIVDSLNKRIKFLSELVEALDLSDVTLCHSRAEDFGQNKAYREQFDFVTARAVARLNVLSELCLPLVKKDGYFLAMKAAKSEEELSEAQKAIAVLGGKFIRETTTTLPSSEEDKRSLIVIQKKKETPKKYPRKAGTPNKSPLK